jgi:hypothetical protein
MARLASTDRSTRPLDLLPSRNEADPPHDSRAVAMPEGEVLGTLLALDDRAFGAALELLYAPSLHQQLRLARAISRIADKASASMAPMKPPFDLEDMLKPSRHGGSDGTTGARLSSVERAVVSRDLIHTSRLPSLALPASPGRSRGLLWVALCAGTAVIFGYWWFW